MALGRRRGFDTDATLDKVVEVFWRHGYEGSSMAAITSATGLSKPSLYAAFGDKEQLFRIAFTRYRQHQTAFTGRALQNPKVRAGIEALLIALVDSQTQTGMPHGCLMVHGNLVGAPESEPIREELAFQRRALAKIIRARLSLGQSVGDFPKDVNVKDFALYITTQIQGLAIQAASGESRKSLYKVVKMSMQAWPDSD